MPSGWIARGVPGSGGRWPVPRTRGRLGHLAEDPVGPQHGVDRYPGHRRSAKYTSPEGGAARWHVVGSRTAPNPAVLEAEQMRPSSFILVSIDRRRTAPELLLANQTPCDCDGEQDHALRKRPPSF